MTIFGENFFRIFNLNKEIQVNKTNEVNKVHQVEKSETVDKDKDKEQNFPKENEECIGCSLKHSDHCAKCLKVQQIYV